MKHVHMTTQTPNDPSPSPPIQDDEDKRGSGTQA